MYNMLYKRYKTQMWLSNKTLLMSECHRIDSLKMFSPTDDHMDIY